MHGSKGLVKIVLTLGIAILIVLVFIIGNVLATPLLKLTPESKAADVGFFMEAIYASPEDIALNLKVKEPTIIRSGEIPLLLKLWGSIESGTLTVTRDSTTARLKYQSGGTIIIVPVSFGSRTRSATWNIIETYDTTFGATAATDELTVHKQIDRASTNPNYQINFP